MMKKILLLLVFLCAIWLGGVFNKFLMTPNVGVFVLRNGSSQAISSAHVSICGQSFIFSDIQEGDFVATRYDVITDSHYEVKVTLQSGHIMDTEIGYVTNGADFFDVIEVAEDDITHKSRALPGRK